MKILAAVTPRRLAVHGAIALAVGSATAAGVAFASGNNSPGSATSTPPAAISPSPDPVAAAARVVLNRLVARGTINQAQADTIEQDVVGGSVDPRALINDGVVTETQMQAVADTLDQVKRAAG